MDRVKVKVKLEKVKVKLLHLLDLLKFYLDLHSIHVLLLRPSSIQRRPPRVPDAAVLGTRGGRL